MPPDIFTAARNALAAYDAHEVAKQQLVSARAFVVGGPPDSDIVTRAVLRDAGADSLNTGQRRREAMETLRATLAATGTAIPAAPDTESPRALSDALRALEVRDATRDFASGITDPEVFDQLVRAA